MEIRGEMSKAAAMLHAREPLAIGVETGVGADGSLILGIPCGCARVFEARGGDGREGEQITARLSRADVLEMARGMGQAVVCDRCAAVLACPNCDGSGEGIFGPDAGNLAGAWYRCGTCEDEQRRASEHAAEVERAERAKE